MNHQQQAQWRIDEAISAGSKGHLERGQLCAAIAQVHATLALFEQQRIANLIALSETSTDAFWAIHFNANEGIEGKGVSAKLKPEIAAALKIGNQA